LEEWHRYAVTNFLERLQQRFKQHCDHHHQPSPARSRNAQHLSIDLAEDRLDAIRSDIESEAV
jgi:hypothetical protein